MASKRLGELAGLLLAGALVSCAVTAGAPPSARGPRPRATRQEAATGELRVRLVGAPTRGSLRLLVYDAADAFGDLREAAIERSFVLGEAQAFVIEGVAPGEYALVAHLDEDGDGVLDRNFLGIPSEPVGFSQGYRPKGPPVFQRARFTLGPGQARELEIEPYRPLGKLGQIGVGAGAVARSSPYRGDASGVAQPIPALFYSGERLQLLGPELRIGLLGDDRLRLAATARYRLRAYEQDDSSVLAALGDREDTLMAGLALIAELPEGLELSLGYDHDVLDRIGGGAARAGLERGFPIGVVRLTPKLGLRWLSAELAGHDFGVPAADATPAAPAYDVGDALFVELGLGTFVELSASWRLVLDVTVELLPGEVRRSPLVDEDLVLSGFAALIWAI